MAGKLFYTTVTPLLLNVLKTLMAAKEFDAFRLVGGTALSLYRGHRESADIDLFSDSTYNSIDFGVIDQFLGKSYAYVDTTDYKVIGMGKSYFLGENRENCIKLDLFYTDKFIQEILLIDSIRFATMEEIIAMKLEIISNGGRKKDFWDIHELKDDYSYENMLALHKQRYPYTHDPTILKQGFLNYKSADEDFDPVCLKQKHWEIIKLDIIDFVG